MRPFFVKHGSPPTFNNRAEEERWLEKIEGLSDRLDAPDISFWGPLVASHEAGADGYLWVWIKHGRVSEVEPSMVATIVWDINQAAKKMGFTVGVPVKFAEATGEGRVDDRSNQLPGRTLPVLKETHPSPSSSQ